MGDQTNGGINLPQILQALIEQQAMSSQNIAALTEAMQSLATNRNERTSAAPRGSGPKPKEPKPYDGDRSDGKLDDHLRDLRNWVQFYEARGQWADEREKITQASSYLTGKMHRLFDAFQFSLTTFDRYCDWLHRTFRDANKQLRLRDK